MSDRMTVDEARRARRCDQCPHRARFGRGECLHPHLDETDTCPGREEPGEE
ncbi:MAG: hypothetical protein AB7E51_18970 [Pseudodesulfovibrio sp.]|uniref:hypothetical protein n=1 Tax=Pseudodesulfovibrio sp. TaxID=2035812 RepID=UPI003D11828A